MQRWIEDLTRRLGRDANVSATVNVAKGKGAKQTVRQHSRIVQRDGETIVDTTETHVEREEPGDDRQA